MSVIDHKAQAQSRVYAQYRNKTKFMQWIAINGEIGNEIESAYQDISESYNIDNAGTAELDVLGRIVVIGRSFEAQIQLPAFLFGSSQFGGSAQFQTGAQRLIQDLSNDIYRLLIKAKIAKNTNDATLDGIIIALSEIVETSNITITDNEDMSFDIVFDSLTEIEKTVLLTFDIIPKPQGVDAANFIDLSKVTQFGRNQFGSSQLAYKF